MRYTVDDSELPTPKSASRSILLHVNQRFDTSICEVCGGQKHKLISTQTQISVFEPYTFTELGSFTSALVLLGIGIYKYLIKKDRVLFWLGPGPVTLWLRSPIKNIDWQEPIVVESQNPQEAGGDSQG